MSSWYKIQPLDSKWHKVHSLQKIQMDTSWFKFIEFLKLQEELHLI